MLHSYSKQPGLLFQFIGITYAQSCYYPNGDLVSGEAVAACSSSGDSICCPLNWSCLSNSLCMLNQSGNSVLLGRYSCTDSSWGSSCPDFCQSDHGSSTGNQAVLQCSPGKYCCDGDRSFDCCTQPNTQFFSLADGQVIAQITSIPSASQSPSSSSSSRSSKSSSSAVSTTMFPTTLPSSIAVGPGIFGTGSSNTSSQSSTNGSPSVATGGALVDHNAKSTRLALTLGLTLGAIALVLFLLLVHLLVHRRRKQRQARAREAARAMLEDKPSSSPLSPSAFGVADSKLHPDRPDSESADDWSWSKWRKYQPIWMLRRSGGVRRSNGLWESGDGGHAANVADFHTYANNKTHNGSVPELGAESVSVVPGRMELVADEKVAPSEHQTQRQANRTDNQNSLHPTMAELPVGNDQPLSPVSQLSNDGYHGHDRSRPMTAANSQLDTEAHSDGLGLGLEYQSGRNSMAATGMTSVPHVDGVQELEGRGSHDEWNDPNGFRSSTIRSVFELPGDKPIQPVATSAAGVKETV